MPTRRRQRLESSERESRDEVPINAPVLIQVVALLVLRTSPRSPSGEVSAAPKAIVKKSPSMVGRKHTCEKDVTKFDAAEKTDVVLGLISRVFSELIRKSSVRSAAVVERHFRRHCQSRRTNRVRKVPAAVGGRLVVKLAPGLQRSAVTTET